MTVKELLETKPHDYYLFNAIKYLYRWKKKNGITDLHKCLWYINHLIEHKQIKNGDDKMLKIIYQLDEDAYKPVKSHEAAAGFNLFAREDVALSPNETFKFDTGVHVLIPEGYVGLVLPRSGYNCAGVATPTGVIDAGYTGSISVVLVSKYDLKIFKGNRIAQLIIVPLPGVNLVEGDVTGVKSERKLGGFGSSGA